MTNVFRFAKPEPKPEPSGPQEGSICGEAFCIACNHRWTAQTEPGLVGVVDPRLECPACHANRGQWCFDFAPPPDALVRTCNCGGQLFYIRPEGHQCPRCGVYQSYD